MPKQITDIKQFLKTAGRKDTTSVKVKKMKKGGSKFKVRCSKYLYTFVVNDNEKAQKIRQSLPPSVTPKDI